MPGHVTSRLLVAVGFAVLIAPGAEVLASTPSVALAGVPLGTPARRSAPQAAIARAGTPTLTPAALTAFAAEQPAASAATAPPAGAGSTDLPPPPAAGLTPPAPHTLTAVPQANSVASGTAPLESTAPANVPAGPMPTPPAERPVFEKWWFWTALGAVAITAVVIASSSSGPSAPATNLGTMTAF